MAYCRNCGAKLTEGSKFCVSCGEKVIMDADIRRERQSRKNQAKRRIGIALLCAALICAAAILFVRKQTPAASRKEHGQTLTAAEKEPVPTVTDPPAEGAPDMRAIDAQIPKVVSDIMAAPEYISSPASLGTYGDFNGDGTKDLLVTYSANVPEAGSCVFYSLLRLTGSGPEIVMQNRLCQEAGGDSGYCGVTNYQGTLYFTLVRKTANGQGYSEYISLLPWDADGKAITNDGSYYLESTVNMDKGRENGTFLWGDRRISMEEYDEKLNSIAWVQKLTPAMGPDPGYTASFDELLAIGTF